MITFLFSRDVKQHVFYSSNVLKTHCNVCFAGVVVVVVVVVVVAVAVVVISVLLVLLFAVLAVAFVVRC